MLFILTIYSVRGKIDCDDIQLFIYVIQHPNNAIMELHLTGCYIDDEKCCEIVSALQHPHSKVQALYLGDNEIGDKGFEMISKMLQNPYNKLKWLDLSLMTNYSDKGVISLINSLPHPNNKLTSLVLRREGTEFTPNTKRLMIEKIAQSHLQELNISESVKGVFNEQVRKTVIFRTTQQKCLILSSASQIERISKLSAFRKFPQDLNRQVKKMLIGT